MIPVKVLQLTFFLHFWSKQITKQIKKTDPIDNSLEFWRV